MSKPLPEAFVDLAGFTDRWCLETERERHTCRLTSDFADLEALYNALLPRMESMVEHLRGFDQDNLPEPEHNLFLLALCFMEVSLAVEAHGQSTVPNGFDHTRFEVSF